MSDLATLGEDGNVRLSLHPGQQRAWDSTARFVAVLAGTQSGKTSFTPHWLYREIQQRGPGDYLYVTPTYQLLELKARPELVRVFRRWRRLGEYTTSPRRIFTFSEEGSRTTFGKAWDAERDPPTRILFGYASDPETLESATCKAAVCDEAGQRKFKAGAWEAILRRLSLAQGRALITTSVYSFGWLKEKYDRWRAGDRDWEFIQFESIMNPSFSPDEFERARRDLPRWKFDMLYRGLFSRPVGLIYDNFDSNAHRCPRFIPPRDWPRYLGLDFGQVNTAAVLLAAEPLTGHAAGTSGTEGSNGRLYLYRTYHEGSRSTQAHVRALLHGEPGMALVAGGSRSEKGWREEWRAAGLPVREPHVPDVEVGIDRVYAAISRGELIVFDDLQEFHDEITTYSRALDVNGSPTAEIEDKSSYHLLDALRYIVSEVRASRTRALQEKRVDFYGT